MNEDGLDQLEAEICDRLLADPWFAAARQLPDLSYATIPVLSEESGDIDTMIAKAVAELGLCVTVKVLEAKVTHTDIGGPYFDPIEIVLLVAENVVLNRGDTGTQKKGKATALRAGYLLSGYGWKPASLANALTCNKDAYRQVDDSGGLVQHNFRLQAKGGLSLTLPQVAPPVFAEAEGSTNDVVHLSCATPGAAIFWTEDGRHPAPRTGTFYNGEVGIASPGRTIKARAFLAGYRDSAIATGTFIAV